jgi:hypothetical protein
MAALHLEKMFEIAQNNSSDPVLTVSDMAEFLHFMN